MGKLVMAISAGVTAFVLALTAGAVYVSRNLTTTVVVAQASTSVPVSSMQAAPVAAATSVPQVPANVAAQDAASIAAKYLNKTDLYSVELADVQGMQAYKVTFSSGDIVMVSLQGQVLSTTPPPAPSVVTVAGGGGGGKHHGGGGGGEGGGESEGGDGGGE
jgi:uncharacterized membrane protein YgcG